MLYSWDLLEQEQESGVCLCVCVRVCVCMYVCMYVLVRKKDKCHMCMAIAFFENTKTLFTLLIINVRLFISKTDMSL